MACFIGSEHRPRSGDEISVIFKPITLPSLLKCSSLGWARSQSTSDRNDLQRRGSPLVEATSLDLDEDPHRIRHHAAGYGNTLRLEFQLQGRLVPAARPTKLLFSNPGRPIVLATFDQTWGMKRRVLYSFWTRSGFSSPLFRLTMIWTLRCRS